MKPLEDLQKEWDAVNSSTEELLTPDKIKRMIQQRYHRRMWSIIVPEILGSLVCLYFAALIFFFFYKLDTPFLQAVGVGTILLLITVPFVSLWPLFRMYRLGRQVQTYKESLAAFAEQKIWIHRVQRFAFGAGFLLFNAMIVVCTKIYNEYDVTKGEHFWAIAFVVGLGFVYVFTRFVQRYYKRAIADAEALLTDLNE